MKDNTSYVEVSAYIRVLEKRLLNNASINRIMDAQGAAETLRQITQNSEYDFSAIKTPEEYENVLKDGLAAVYSEMRQLLPGSPVVEIPAAKYVFHNIKTALKAKHTGKPADSLYSPIPLEDWRTVRDYVNGEAMENPPPDYVAGAVREAEEAFAETGDPQDIDVVLDKLMFERMSWLCEQASNDLITGYVREMTDFQNIKTLLRVKAMKRGSRFLGRCLIPGGNTELEFFLRHYDKNPETLAQVFYYKYFGGLVQKGMEGYSRTETFAGLERMFDDRLIELTKQAKLAAYGPEVPFAYIQSKENEARQIRILAACKMNGIGGEALRERLRDNYA